jgi:hypothetical protein
MAELPETMKTQLACAVSSLDPLSSHAAQLLRDADHLSRYLLTGPRELAQGAIEKLNQQIAGASEEAVRRVYLDALSARREQLASIAYVAVEQERILAALQSIVGTLEGLPAWIYRMGVLALRVKENRVNETCEELTRMKTELAASVQVLDGLGCDGGDAGLARLETSAGDRRRELAPIAQGDAQQHHGHDRKNRGDEQGDQVTTIDENDLKPVHRLAVHGSNVG